MTNIRPSHTPFHNFLLKGSVAVLLCCVLTQLQALAFGPPLALFQDIPPGFEVDLKKVGQFSFRVANRSKNPQSYVLSIEAPPTDNRKSWEYGYEPIPDLSWCKMHKDEITVPGATTEKVSLTIQIPEKPENYNRKFLFYVRIQSGTKQNIGVGLSLVARVLVETKVKPDVDKLGGKGLAFAPGQITLKGKPGSEFSAEVLLQNNFGKDINLKQAKLSDFYQEFKFQRYQSSGFTLLPKKGWLSPVPDQTVKKDGKNKYKISGTIPDSAKAGDKYEELLFIKPFPVKNEEKKTPEEIEASSLASMSFLRIQYIVE